MAPNRHPRPEDRLLALLVAGVASFVAFAVILVAVQSLSAMQGTPASQAILLVLVAATAVVAGACCALMVTWVQARAARIPARAQARRTSPAPRSVDADADGHIRSRAPGGCSHTP